MKNVLVAGGAGFIGSNLCDFLLKREDRVICVDNLITSSRKNIAKYLSHENFTFIEQDVCQPIKKGFSKIDEIYDMASPADPNSDSPISYMTFPFETMQVNTIGLWNLCSLALKHKAKILFASTSEVYGDPLESPQKETYRGNVSTTGPRSVYDEAKRFGETIISAYVREKSLDGRIVRIFNTYGPNMNINEGRAVVNFIKQALRGENITLFGDGLQTRSFCYIDDLINGLVKAMEKNGTKGGIFNLGNDDERTIKEFAQIIKRLTKSKSTIVFSKEMPQDDPRVRKPDISKAKKVLGWEPKVGLEKGLTQTIDYFKKLI
jgi:nucleoside-diphosphate-sugar epimerase